MSLASLLWCLLASALSVVLLALYGWMPCPACCGVTGCCAGYLPATLTFTATVTGGSCGIGGATTTLTQNAPTGPSGNPAYTGTLNTGGGNFCTITLQCNPDGVWRGEVGPIGFFCPYSFVGPPSSSRPFDYALISCDPFHVQAVGCTDGTNCPGATVTFDIVE